jgi:hypothetical protein
MQRMQRERTLKVENKLNKELMPKDCVIIINKFNSILYFSVMHQQPNEQLCIRHRRNIKQQ